MEAMKDVRQVIVPVWPCGCMLKLPHPLIGPPLLVNDSDPLGGTVLVPEVTVAVSVTPWSVTSAPALDRSDVLVGVVTVGDLADWTVLLLPVVLPAVTWTAIEEPTSPAVSE